MSITADHVIWAYKFILGRVPESDDVIEIHKNSHDTIDSLRTSLFKSTEFKKLYGRICNSDEYYQMPTILIQNFHPAATKALVRDFRRIGFRVLSPDCNWFFDWYSPNEGMGSELISYDEFMRLPPGRILISCLQQEENMLMLADRHNDDLILHAAQHNNYYKIGISKLIVCPDIITYNGYPDDGIEKILYFPKPHLSSKSKKDIVRSFQEKIVCSYINNPDFWPLGNSAMDDFSSRYEHTFMRFGHGAEHGMLDHASCNNWMSRSFLTIHFKEMEAYGLSCIESMLLGTPIVALKPFLGDKTLGEFFLNESNSIFVDSVSEAMERINSLTLNDYKKMSENCTKCVLDLTSDKNTIDRLRSSVFKIK